MANYPVVPVALSTLDETQPTGAEDASKIDDALRQTRTIFKSILNIICNDDGTLKAAPNIGANTVGSSQILTGAVTTAKLDQTGGTEAVTTACLRDANVTAAKLATNAVEEAKIKDGAVTTNKLGALAVTDTKIADDAVTAAKLKDSVGTDLDRAVTTNHIRDLAVTEGKIAAASVSIGKLKADGALEKLYYQKNSSVGLYELDTTGGISAGIVGGKLKFTLNSDLAYFSNAALFLELGTDGGKASMNQAIGSYYYTGWQPRPFKVDYSSNVPGNSTFTMKWPSSSALFALQSHAASLLNYPYTGCEARVIETIKLLQAGTYYIEFEAAVLREGTNKTSHAVRIVKHTASVDPLTFVVVGESTAHIGSSIQQDFAFGRGVFTAVDNDEIHLEHCVEAQAGGNTGFAYYGEGADYATEKVLAAIYIMKVA